MRAVLGVIISTIISGVCGAISFALPMYWFLWEKWPDAKKPLALLGAIPYGDIAPESKSW
ncbi:hypothetical protein NIES4071_43420 [Calothrix sp. NIES-4071]|nr:hypothetical protein NIES4071_43420 [Calothrix sp. NIES-4071]BAZ58656.1 hypothetical protein NIES4105_43350 [Calothrix sp. NIES-4105]